MAVTEQEVQQSTGSKEYELASGKRFRLRPPTYKVIREFDELGWKAKKSSSNGKYEKDSEGRLIYDDERPYYEVVRQRVSVIFDLPDDFDFDELLIPEAIRAHADFLSLMSPMALGQQKS